MVPTVFRPRPQADVRGRRVAYFTTAAPRALPALTAHLTEAHGAEVVLVSGDLARRPALAEAVRRAQAVADVFLTEIKAAAIDVVAEAAAEAGKQIVFCDNEPLALPGADLTAAVAEVVGTARRRYAAAGAGPEASPSEAPGARPVAGTPPPVHGGRLAPWPMTHSSASASATLRLPFSKGLMAQSLMATGLPPERAYHLAAAVERWLNETGGHVDQHGGAAAAGRAHAGDRVGPRLSWPAWSSGAGSAS